MFLYMVVEMTPSNITELRCCQIADTFTVYSTVHVINRAGGLLLQKAIENVLGDNLLSLKNWLIDNK